MFLTENGLKIVESRLEKEFKNTAELMKNPLNRIDYLWMLYPNIHSRCSSAISHLSIMFGLVFFLLKFQIEYLTTNSHSSIMLFLTGMAILDVLLYAWLLILSLRCIKPFGLDDHIDKPKDYEDAFFKDLALKFYYLDFMNKGTKIGIIFSVVLLISFVSLSVTFKPV